MIDKDQQIYFQNGQKYNYGKNYCVWIGLERKLSFSYEWKEQDVEAAQYLDSVVVKTYYTPQNQSVRRRGCPVIRECCG